MDKERDPSLEPALRDIESIQSLDTARLALRWALERMRALERRLQEIEGDAKRAQDARAKTSAELEAAQELLTRRAGEMLERERYYGKIEEYLNLRLSGQLDPAALARREARLEEREAELQRREIETERKLKASKLRYDEELRRELADAAAAADARVKEARDEFQRRLASREREEAHRQLSLHEKEAQLSALERSLEERRRRFEEFFASQRAALASEASAINETSRDQAEFLERRVEQALAAKSSALESAWRTEKQALMDELAEWRTKARAHLPALLEAQRKAAAIEETNACLLEEKRCLEEVKASLSQEISRWRGQAQRDIPNLISSGRRADEAQERAQRLEAELAAVRRQGEESLAELISLELGEEHRLAELERLESSLAAKMRDAERNLFRHYDSWLHREEELRRRDQDWRNEAESRRESAETVRAEIHALREELKKAVDQYRRKSASSFPREQED